jgi:glucosamine--fructose-6-phosphate aminotransferase (isomerizing)
MCGITAILSKQKKNVLPLLKDSLQQLQNRGYDSFGVSYWSDTSFFSHKTIGHNRTDDFDLFADGFSDKESTNVIGHTRWATHGGITLENTHPHTSNQGHFILVHNGIIENYQELKTFLCQKGFHFVSDTDTEVIVNLMEYYFLQEKKNILESIEHTVKRLEGTYGLAIQCKPEEIYLVRHGSPLLVGENDHVWMATSEKSGFVQQLKEYYVLPNDKVVILGKQGIVFMEKTIAVIEEEPNMPSPFLHWTLKEIMEQHYTLSRAMNYGARVQSSIKLGGIDFLEPHVSSLKHILLLGCGTSFYACEIGSLFMKHSEYQYQVKSMDAGEFEEQDIPIGKTLMIFCSQSGETKDLHRVLEMVQGHSHVITLGVINVVDSQIAREVHCGVYMNAGKEVAVASTKTFTSSLLILKMIALWIKERNPGYIPKPRNYEDLRQIPSQIQSFLQNLPIRENHISILNKEHVFILGKGTFKTLACEMALKLKEIAYIHAEGYSASALKHGPFALLGPGFPVLLLMDKPHQKKLLSVYKEIESRGGDILVITEIKDLDLPKEKVLVVPENKEIQEIIYAVVLQMLAYRLSIARGIHPDKPRNLAKVVTVE